MPAAVIGGIIAGAGAIGAAAIGASAQKKASQQATQAAQDATTQNNALQREIYASNRDTLSPFYQSGYGATSMINALLGIPQQQAPQQGFSPANNNAPQGGYSMADALAGRPYAGQPPNYYDTQGFGGGQGGAPGGAQPPQGTVAAAPLDYNQAFQRFRDSTGYQFRLGEGMRALESGWAGAGLMDSGAAKKAAIKFGQDYGSGEFGNFMGYLGNQQGMGLSAAGALAGVSTNFANSTSNNNNALASVLANSALARGQANAGLWGTAAGALGQIGGGLISSYGAPKAPQQTVFNDNIVRYVS